MVFEKMKKKRCHISLPENVHNLMSMKSNEMFGKDSASAYALAAICWTLGMTGCKFGWSLTEQDKWMIKRLKKLCYSHIR